MKLRNADRIIVLATWFFVSLGLYVEFAIGGSQGHTNALPSAGPPIPEADYEPWSIGRQKKIEGFVRDYQPNNAEKQLLSLSREEQEKFAHLINQPNAGAFRLLSAHPHTGKVISINSPEFSKRPGFSLYASSYSFTRKKHGHGVNGWNRNTNWSLIDLALMGKNLVSGVADESLGLMVQLGDVPLERVNEQTDGVAELAEFVAPTDYRAFNSLLEKNRCAYKRNGLRFAQTAVAVINNTYALRSTLNRRADQLIAFRVIRQDDEENLSIIWRRLKTYPKPSWVSEKRVDPHTKTFKPCPLPQKPKQSKHFLT